MVGGIPTFRQICGCLGLILDIYHKRIKPMPGIYSYKTCINCGAVKRSNGKKYCSAKCQQDFQHKSYIKEWLDGKRDGVRGKAETSTHIKKYLLEVRGIRCESCKNTEWMGREIPISLHHSDGNFKNNNLENLVLLCPNCHTQTPNFGRKNAGNGRPRYDRYNFDATATSDEGSIPS